MNLGRATGIDARPRVLARPPKSGKASPRRENRKRRQGFHFAAIAKAGVSLVLWEAARAHLPGVREDRPGQPVYVLDDEPAAGGSALRPATLHDLDLLIRTSAAAFLEEVGIDAYSRDPALFEWRTRTQIEEGRSWLWEEAGTILFKAEASAWTDRTVQLQQVWVDPSVRGNGYGKRGLADLCRLLLARTPSVCLFVRPENTPAIALYDSIGMRRVGMYRSLIFE